MASLDAIVHGRRPNAVLGWAFVGVIGVAALASALGDDYLWAGLAVLIAIVGALPAVADRDWETMVPWPLLAFAAVAAVVRALGYWPEIAGYLGLTAFALIVVVELDCLEQVEMSRRFAVAFGVLTAMAVQGLWTVGQFYADRWLGTGYLRGQLELQWDYVWVTAVALCCGALFALYLGQVQPAGTHGWVDS